VLRQSYMYLVLQLLNVFIGLFVTIYIAQNVDTATFAIFAIYIIITTIFTTFSFLGYETVLIRNVLHWQKNNQINKVINYISYAIISRLITSVILVLPILGYIYYLSIYKFNDQHFVLFSSFIIAGIFSSLANANGLILKAFNRYILSFSIMTLSSIFGRLLAIYVFTVLGFKAFIVTLILTPIFAFIISFFYIKSYFSFNQIKYRYLFKFLKFKYFIFSGYLNYFKVSIDQFLVSIFLSIEVLAVYNLAKKVEEVGRSSVEGFFDPVIQKTIQYKANRDKAVNYKKKICLIKNIFLLVAIVFVLTFNLYVNEIIIFSKLENYTNLNYYLIFASWMPIIYLMHKVQSNIIYLFDDQKKIFKIDLSIGIVTTSLVLIFLTMIGEEYIYLNRVITGIVVTCFFQFYYKKYFCKKSIFNEANIK